MKNYKSISEKIQNLIIIERSKFICNVFPVCNETDVKNKLQSIKKEHPFANHNCYAYILNNETITQKFSDDGEPQGTAGLPILDVIKKRDLTNILCVVTRYFGGIKLGAGGLVRAYSDSVSKALDLSIIKEYFECYIQNIHVTYEEYKLINRLFFGEGIKVLETKFLDKVYIRFVCKNEEIMNKLNENINNALSKNVKLEKIEKDYFIF